MLKQVVIVLLFSLSTLGLVPPPKDQPTPPSKVSPLVKVYKYQGSRQCHGGGEPLAQMRRQLIKVGVKVISAQCGSDGRMYPTVCGAGDGKINIFTIQRSSLGTAKKHGFVLLQSLPDAQMLACR